MTAINLGTYALPRIQPQQKARNNMYPSAGLVAEINSLANQLFGLRTKELAHYMVPIAAIPTAATARTRFRFAAHTSPSLSTVVAICYFAGPDHGIVVGGVSLALTNVTGGTSYGSGSITNGSFSTIGDTPSNFGFNVISITGVPVDTDIYGTVQDTSAGRLIAMTVYELAVQPDTANGYLSQKYALFTPVLDTDRAAAAAMAVKIWQRQASPVMRWSCDLDSAPITIASVTHLNIIDGTSVAPSAATPGYTLDLRFCARQRGGSLVPCVFTVYGSGNIGGTGSVELVDSGGATIATAAIPNTATAQYVSVTCSLPSTLAKYDVRYFSTGGTLSVWSVDLYQLV